MARKLTKAEHRHRRFAQSRYASIEREHQQHKDVVDKAISTLRDGKSKN